MVNNYSFNAFEDSGASTSWKLFGSSKRRFAKAISFRVKRNVKVLSVFWKPKTFREFNRRIPRVFAGYLREINFIINSCHRKSRGLLTWLAVLSKLVEISHDS